MSDAGGKEMTAEFLGTLVLSLSVLLALKVTSLAAPVVLAALSVALLVYSLGHISGAQFNPAITLGLWSVKKLSGGAAVKYIVAQLIGARVAVFLAGWLVPQTFRITAHTTTIAGVAELLGTFVLAFGIASVVAGKTKQEASGLVVGGSVLLGATLAGAVSNGAINPAVAWAMGTLSLPYVWGPVVGAALAFRVYEDLNKK